MPNKVHRFDNVEEFNKNEKNYKVSYYKGGQDYSDTEFNKARANLRNVLYSIDI